MKFQRRLDLSGETRLRIVLEVLLEAPYNWGCISGLAAKYKISRQFIYNLRNRLLSPFAVERQGKPDLDHDGKFVPKLLLCLLLYGYSSLEGSSRTLDVIGLGLNSIGSISGCLAATAAAVAERCSILDAVKFIRRNVEDFWGYFERLEEILAHFGKTITKQLLQSLCLVWQLDRKAMAVKDYRLSKQLAKRAAEQKSLSLNALPEKLRSEAETLFTELEANIRSSSPLEAINSQLRDFFDGCRGQFTQDTLKLLVFFLNHKKARRGKYAGSSPYERFSGIMEAAAPIDLYSAETLQESQRIFDEELWRRVS